MGPSADAREDREYRAPWIRPCSKSLTLFDLIADIVGNDIPVRLAMVADMNIVLFVLATPYR